METARTSGSFPIPGPKRALKKLRASQPFNCIVTTVVRMGLRLANRESEWVIRHLARAGVVRAELPNGHTLLLKSNDDWIANQVFWRGWNRYEEEVISVFWNLARSARSTFDIGSNTGLFALLAAHANPEGKVFAFEAMPRVYDRLEQNVRINHLTNIDCRPWAVGESNENRDFFFVPTVELPSSSSVSREYMARFDGLTSASVKGVRLDEFIRDQQIDRVDLMKIDTETTEPEVLLGMGAILERDRPNTICEVLENRGTGEPLQAILEPLGYRFYRLTDTGPERSDRIEGRIDANSYLFTVLADDDVMKLRES